MVLTVSTGLCVPPRLWQRQDGLMWTCTTPFLWKKKRAAGWFHSSVFNLSGHFCQERRKSWVEALKKRMPKHVWTRPDGGCFPNPLILHMWGLWVIMCTHSYNITKLFPSGFFRSFLFVTLYWLHVQAWRWSLSGTGVSTLHDPDPVSRDVSCPGSSCSVASSRPQGSCLM